MTIPRALSPGEEAFAMQCRAFKLEPVREFSFHPKQKWRFDFAFPAQKIAVEIEGGTAFGKSYHSKGEGFVKDCHKYNSAARLGWMVLRYSTQMVMDGNAIDDVLEVLR